MTWYLVKSEQAFLVKIWLPTLRSIRTWVQCQGISSFFSSCTTINKGKLLFSEAYLTDCLLVELTFEQAERERGKITRLQSVSVWRNDGGKEMDESWVGKGLGVRERTGMPLLWLFPALPCPSLHTACYLAPCLKLVGGSPTQEWVDGKSGIQLCNTLVCQHYSTHLYLPFSPTRSHRSH